MSNPAKFQVESANQVKLAQSPDRLWTDLSSNESASYSGGMKCRYRRIDDTLVCRATGVP